MKQPTIEPLVLDVQKDGGNWEYVIRTAQPHNHHTGRGKHVATVNTYLRNAQELAVVMTAAPDLLDLLRQAAERVRIANAEGDPILSAWLSDADAAIAKATDTSGI